MNNTPARRTGIWNQLRDELRTRRQSHDAMKALQHDLSSYRAESDLADLDAIIDRQDPANTVEIRRILARQRAA
jgi:hypothetical protein